MLSKMVISIENDCCGDAGAAAKSRLLVRALLVELMAPAKAALDVAIDAVAAVELAAAMATFASLFRNKWFGTGAPWGPTGQLSGGGGGGISSSSSAASINELFENLPNLLLPPRAIKLCCCCCAIKLCCCA